jgi:hypothetical protein
MGIKRGVWRQGESGLGKDLSCEELVMSDDRVTNGGVNPYESIGAVAAGQLGPRRRDNGVRSGSGGNPYEHGANSPERAWDGAGLDTRDCDEKASWLESRLARGAGSVPGSRGRQRRK